MNERLQRLRSGRRVWPATIIVGALALIGASCSSSASKSSGSAVSTTSPAAATSPTSETSATSVPAPSTTDATGGKTNVTTNTAAGATTTAVTAIDATTTPPTAAATTVPVTPTTPPTSASPATTVVKLPGSVRVVSMSFPSMTAGWVLADRSDGTRVLLKTTDAGATWAPSATPAATGALQVLFADTTNGWVVGDGGLQATHDGGGTWAAATVAGMSSAAAVAAAGGKVHVAYVGQSGIKIASSPVDHDAFVAAAVTVAFGAGPRLDVSMSAGGSYGEMMYNDRTFIGGAEIRNGAWAKWNIACPIDVPSATAGLSPQGKALAIACSPSGFGDNAAVVGANLTSGTLAWTTIEPAGGANAGQASVDFATATDAGARIVAFTKGDGSGVIATSTDGGATWPTRTSLPSGATPIAITHLPDGSLLMSTNPSGGMSSADGLTWAAVATSP